jgi:hypothetical protein
MHRYHTTRPFSCGVNPTSISWALMKRRFAACASRFYFDIKRFDYSFPPGVIFAFVQYANEFLGDFPWEYKGHTYSSADIRTFLFYHLAYAVLILVNILVMICGVNPSGGAITTELNSYVTYLILFLCTHHILKENNLPCDWFSVTCSFVSCIYGDDSEYGPLHPCLTQDSIVATALLLFGITLKVGDPTFLQRGELIRPECGTSFCFAPLKLATILDSVNWQSTAANLAESFRSSLDSATLECLQHGREVYDLYTSSVSKACADRGLNYTYLPFDVAIRSLIDKHYV